MILREKNKPRTRLRAWDVNQASYPERSPQDWLRVIREAREGHAFRQVFEEQNAATDPGMETLAAIMIGEQAAWQNGLWAKQAIGCGDTAAIYTQRELVGEIYRKGFTEFVRDTSGTSRIITANTFYGAADFTTLSTTVEAAPAPTTTVFTLASVTGLRVNDMIRVGLTGGYEYVKVTAIAGAEVTVSPALSAAPAAADTVDQVIEEAGVFGDVPAGYTTGTIAVTNGSPTVTGTGTAWEDKLAAGDKIRLASSRVWYTVLSVDSDTQITLSANFAEATASGESYVFRGSCFSRGSGVRHVKPADRGFVFETVWEMGGA